MPSSAEYIKQKLKEVNDDIRVRRISVKNASGEVVKLEVELASFTPLLTTPINNIEKAKLFPVDVTPSLFNGFNFEELTILKEEGAELTGQDATDFIDSRKKLIDPSGTKNRYLELLTIDNPVTKIDYTIFIDLLHKDMFIVSGLKLLLDDALDVNPSLVIPHVGTHIGGMVEYNDKEWIRTVLYKYPFDKTSYFKINDILNDKATIAGKTFKCYGVSTTKDLSGDAANVVHPVTYQNISGLKQGEVIQVARQDTIPIIVLELGKMDNFTTGGNVENTLPNCIMYNNTLNSFRKFNNYSTHKADAVFSITLPLY